MTLSRRSFVRMAAVGCACCAAGGHAFAKSDVHWGYKGDIGPDSWADLSADFQTCSTGDRQTPIDLTGATTGSDAPALIFDYKPFPLAIVNNGHTIQVNAAPGSSCTIGDTKYELLQFHFHHPSEHLLNGETLNMECHLVHKSAEGGLAVIGIFFTPGNENVVLKPLFDQMPSKAGETVTGIGTINPRDLFPASGAYFGYQGSLTTPPCSEGLNWTVFKHPVELSPEQIKQFASLYAHNARPVQPLNGRPLLEML